MPTRRPSRRMIASPKPIRRCATPRRSGTTPAHSSASPRPNSSATASRRRSKPCPAGTPSSSSAARRTTRRKKRALRRRSSTNSTRSWVCCATRRPPSARNAPSAPHCRPAWQRLRSASRKSWRTLSDPGKSWRQLPVSTPVRSWLHSRTIPTRPRRYSPLRAAPLSPPRQSLTPTLSWQPPPSTPPSARSSWPTTR